MKLKKSFFLITLILITLVACFSFCKNQQSDTKTETSSITRNKIDKGVDYTFMVYLVGSDLESESQAATNDLEEMMGIGSTNKVNVIVQTGGANEWFNEVSADMNQRWYVKNGSLKHIENLDDLNMGNSNTLSDFIVWGITNYPANNYILVLWNHGMGGVDGYGHDEKSDDHLTLPELEEALADAYNETEEIFEIIGFDACLMATIEIANLVSPYAKYLVASEELEPVHGWDYYSILDYMKSNPKAKGAEIGKTIANGFKNQATEWGTSECITLSVTDLSKIPDVIKSIDTFVGDIENEDINSIAKARAKSQDYGSDVAQNSYTDMVDLYDLSENMYKLLGIESAKTVMEKTKNAVVYSINSKGTAKATGLTIYFPHRGREMFENNTNEYNKNNFNDNYKSLVSRYSSVMLGDTESISFNKENNKIEYSYEVEGEEEIYTYKYGEEYEDTYYAYIEGNIDDLSEIYTIIATIEEIDGESHLTILGMDSDVTVEEDEEGNMFASSVWNGSWITLDGHQVAMYLEYEDEKIMEYSIPVEIKGKEMNIIVVFYNEDNTYEILGASAGINPETGAASKKFIKLNKGDKITPLFESVNLDTGEDEFLTGEEFVLSNMELGIEPLAVGTYMIGFYAIDYAQNDSFSDFFHIEIEE